MQFHFVSCLECTDLHEWKATTATITAVVATENMIGSKG